MVGFIFGGNTGETPESVKRKREIAMALLGSQAAPKTIGEGISALGDGIVANVLNRRASEAEKTGRDSANQAFGGLDLGAMLGSAPAFPASVAAGGSPTAPAATGVADPSSIKKGLLARGLPEHVADGFMMNFQDESGLNPGINEKNPTVAGSRGGFGLYQLTGPRRRAYESFAAQRGVDPADTDAQLDFLMTELQGPEANAAKSIMSAPDAGTAAAAIARNFLRPAKEHLDSRVAKYTSGTGQPAVQVASLDPSAGMGQTFSPQQFTAEQLKNGMNIGDESQLSPDDQQRLAQRRGPAPASVPYSGPGARIGDQDYRANFGDLPGGVPKPLSEDERARRLAADQAGMANFGDQIAAPMSAEQAMAGIPPRSNYPEAGKVAPVDWTDQPQFSVAAGMQFANGQTPQGQSQSNPKSAVRDALLRKNDAIFGGALAPQGQQPTQVADNSGQYFPPAPSGQPNAGQGSDARAATVQKLMQAAQNPWLNDSQKAIVNSLLQNQMQQADPMRQLQMQKIKQEIDQGGRTKQWQKLDENRLFSPVTGETIDLPSNPDAQSGDLGLNPQYGLDKDGNPVLLQLGKNGKVVQSQMPDGVTLSKAPIKLDAGTHFVLLDPVTRQPVGQIPKDNAGAEQDKAQGKAAGEAKSALPSIEQNANNMLGAIDSLDNDPYLESMLGPVNSRMPNVTGNSARVQSKMDQITGQTFLQAFNSLRGGGAITDVEGAKATQALARLNTAQNPKDYRDALNELRTIVTSGVTRAREKAGMVGAPAIGPAINGGGSSVDDLLKKYGG